MDEQRSGGGPRLAVDIHDDRFGHNGVGAWFHRALFARVTFRASFSGSAVKAHAQVMVAAGIGTAGVTLGVRAIHRTIKGPVGIFWAIRPPPGHPFAKGEVGPAGG